ncbi:MAG: sulfatase-like hydrolase/transferase [Thermoguttaceae bacterium]
MPSVDRLSRSGMIFTDWYSRQSCTSGRAAIVTGRYPVRAGLTKVGLADKN